MNKLYLGAHLDNYKNIIDALNKTLELKANVLQIFLGSKYLTSLREKIILSKDEIKRINLFIKEHNIKLFIHGLLSLNYCNDPYSARNYWGIGNLIHDMNLCYQLGGIGVVIHMGTHITKKINISYNNCIKNFINSLIMVLDNTKKVYIILETPVNRKNIVGGTIEKLSELYNSIPEKYIKRVKTCIDTQHIFASGYNIRTLDGIKEYLESYKILVGIKNLLLIHLNDSEKEFDSKIDRHAPIGEGFIFSNNKVSLKYIIDFAIKYKISLILETRSKNFNYEINYLKKLSTNQDGGEKDIKPLILKIFKDILVYHENYNKSAIYRIDSYKKAIKTLENFKNPIYNSNNVKNLPNIGKGFLEKIDIISKRGTLNIYENIKKNKKIKAIKVFQKIWGIGPKFSKELLNKKIYTLKNLKKSINNGSIELTSQQLIGLKYYDDLNKRIKRDEIYNYTEFIKDKIKHDKIEVHNAGSYRIGKMESGDIDLIISYENMDNIKNYVYDSLKEIIYETLTSGLYRSTYICKLHNYKYYRKIDIAYVEKKNLPWYLLYFGSSRDFSKKIRNIASKLGYKLNEKGLYSKKTLKRIDFNPKDEKAIFDFLGIEYIKPSNR